MIYQLSPRRIDFPDPHYGDPDGLFAIGGDLSEDRLILAYSHGIFPWYAYRKGETLFHDSNGRPCIQWWCPMDRFVIFPEEIHVSHSMRTLLNKGRYACSFNRAFDRVINHCGSLRDHERGAWLGPNIIKAYTRLYELGYCTSVEVWDTMPAEPSSDCEEGYQLVGGLYGVTIGKAFMGESMFSLVPSGSKIALIFLAKWMEQNGLTLIDCQFETPHLLSMGGRHIHYDEYMELITEK